MNDSLESVEKAARDAFPDSDISEIMTDEPADLRLDWQSKYGSILLGIKLICRF